MPGRTIDLTAMTTLTELPAWRALAEHAREVSPLHMRDLFAADRARFERFSLEVDGLLLDYSKNRVTGDTLALLAALARARGVEALRDAMLRGERINLSEDRAVLHTALRRTAEAGPLVVDGVDVMEEILAVRAKMRAFSEAVRGGSWRGHTGEPIRDVVNIGIGGSDLGPAMVCEALAPYHDEGPRMHFVSNVDPAHFARTAAALDPRRTLFIIASKTFTTLETMSNAAEARRWLLASGAPDSAVARHFVALSTNADKVREFGIDPDNMFRFRDFVGGRYSLWSAVGLSIAIAAGMDRFEQLLAGAHRMDRHFAETPIERNLPMILALLGAWYRNFLGLPNHLVVPYDQNLARFPAHLQQLDMESNGKGVTRDGDGIDTYDTGPAVWGEAGCNSQHSFFQLLHQGTTVTPVDFLVAAGGHYGDGARHRMLVASCLAQSRALMHGRTAGEARAELERAGLDEQTIARRLPHSVFPGNRPSNTLAYARLDPHTLGMLIAAYEHKVFVQGAIWNVNSFDQWGVELGKQLTGPIAEALEHDDGAVNTDASTTGLADFLRRAGK